MSTAAQASPEEHMFRVAPRSNDSTCAPVNTLCINCSAPLDSLSVRCLSCGYRHPMTSCHCCGDPVFKHGATRIVKKSWREFPSQGSFLHRLLRWIRQPRHKQIFYLHPHCVEEHPEFLKGAFSVTEAKKEFIRPVLLNGRKLQADGVAPQTDPSLQFVEDGDSQMTISHLTDSQRFRNQKDEESSNTDRLFNAYFGDGSSALPDVLHAYHSGERDFSHAQLEGVSLDGQNLLGLNLKGANLRRGCWKNVGLPEVNLSGAIADYARFENVRLMDGLFRQSSFRDVTVILSDLTQADFYKADLRRSDFYSSNFHRSILTLANLTAAKLDGTDLSLACLLMATLSHASLMEANLEGATLENANLSSANLNWANLKDAVATGANLSDAVLQHSDLEGIELSGAQLLGADFLGSSLLKAGSLQGATYNDFTRFPDEFRPEEQGMIKV